MRDVEICSSAIAAACPEGTVFSGWRGWIARLFNRKQKHYVVSENSPEYLLRDIGLIEGRSSRLSRHRQKLPEWK
ncbi:hypothetical protein [Brucella rhizosphaerae]|uniref:Uncharacterized protein n=1 Tax=Brucella rhizosphaerae TaxID=571254 RepID=A0A256FTD4_9HYPH|nr:hypothetical protein [Brucella rhizosphaerae]OYR18008.1 hypothetical protein CEV32_3618 [Brucella rhizosphaerae]